MRKSLLILATAAAAACAHRSLAADPDSWTEAQSAHFTLLTDLDQDDASRAASDLEYIHAALLAAGWHGTSPSAARTTVVLFQSASELKRFVRFNVEGMTTYDRYGERIILVNGGANLLGSELVKHELTHALVFEYLVTDPRWVQEGIASLLETLDIDRDAGTAVRGASPWRRRLWLREDKPKIIQWDVLMGNGASNGELDGYAYETLCWELVHFLVDSNPKGFDDFMARLAHGEGMWQAFGESFPKLTGRGIAAAMDEYLSRQPLLKRTFKVPDVPAGRLALRKLSRAESHALFAELFYAVGDDAGRDTFKEFEDERSLALAADPANPLALSLQQRPNAQLAVARHPDDFRSWALLYDADEKNVDALRKAVALAPGNSFLLSRLAAAEAVEGKSADALAHAERARSLSPTSFVLHTLARLYDKNGRCAEARTEQERAIESLPDRVDPRVPEYYRDELRDIVEHCGRRDTIGTATETVTAEPVLKVCRQPLVVDRIRGISAQFTIREDGSVTAVAIHGAPDRQQNGVLRQFLESCSFEPVVVNGKPRPVQLNLNIEDMVR
ncbi:MAG TPA: hypothetical protein VGH20_20445 [Myxococcales bacterium]|jgi:hypothetical protein